MELICTLTEHVFSDGGSFIPAGTPVRVMSVIQHESKSPFDGGDPQIFRRITVQAAVHAYGRPSEDGPGEPSVWCGLEFEVEPHLLVWLDCGNSDSWTAVRPDLMDQFDGWSA